MKKPILILTALTLAGTALQPATAGDREWATAGKVLTGVAAATVLARALAPAPEPCVTTTYVTAPTTVVAAPPVYVQPTVVYATPPPPPTTVYVQAQPVYVAAPAPCYVAPPVVVYRAPYPYPYYRHGYCAPVWHGGRRHW